VKEKQRKNTVITANACEIAGDIVARLQWEKFAALSRLPIVLLVYRKLSEESVIRALDPLALTL
jgi:protein involved in sex pheromone biosynthesis